MRPGTAAILGHLKRTRSVRFTRQQWADLVDDIAKLGKEKFLRIAVDGEAGARPVPKTTKQAEAPDTLLEEMSRYRKKSGLNTKAFIAALHIKLEGRLHRKPLKVTMTSGPKYLSYLRQSLSADEIETGFADVLAEYG